MFEFAGDYETSVNWVFLAITGLIAYKGITTKNEDGKVDQYANGLADNDVDAFRHAYVSGVFAKELGTGEAKFYGFLQELVGGNGSSANNSDAAKNMDYWNNACTTSTFSSSQGRFAGSRSAHTRIR